MNAWLDKLNLACVAAFAGLVTMGAASAADPYTVPMPDGTAVHIYPTVALEAQIRAARGRSASTPVVYHSGGRIMRTVNIYAIYWAPPHLQNGGATSMPGTYTSVLNRMLGNYAGHAVANINTQYYEVISGIARYHTGLGSHAGSYVDTSLYPASGCTDPATPGNCLSDAQIRAEVTKVRGIKGWGSGFDKIFVVFTSSGEGSCSGASCAYTHYCAYHGYFGSATNPVIYSNEPYGNNSVCQTASVASLPNPGVADSAATAARHEISEATSDPLLNAWWDPTTGEETSDKCNMNYGTRTWDGGKANYQWGGFYFLLQMEYSKHALGCVQQGP